jgi:hypothetical protein
MHSKKIPIPPLKPGEAALFVFHKQHERILKMRQKKIKRIQENLKNGI